MSEMRRTIWMPYGLIGFPGLNRYELGCDDQGGPLATLTAENQQEMTFALLDPFVVRPDYDLQLTPDEIDTLEVDSRSDLDVFVILTVPADPMEITVDFRAPLLVSRANDVAIQKILTGDGLPVNVPLAAELRREQMETMI